jgi:hypothetical protein
MYTHVYTCIHPTRHIHITCFGKIDNFTKKFATDFEVDVQTHAYIHEEAFQSSFVFSAAVRYAAVSDRASEEGTRSQLK